MVATNMFMEARHAPIGNTFLTDEQEAELVSAFAASLKHQQHGGTSPHKSSQGFAISPLEEAEARGIRSSGCGGARRRSQSTSSITSSPNHKVTDILTLSPSSSSQSNIADVASLSPRPLFFPVTPPVSPSDATLTPHSSSPLAPLSPDSTNPFAFDIATPLPLMSAAIDHMLSTPISGYMDWPSDEQNSTAVADIVSQAPVAPWQRSFLSNALFLNEERFGQKCGVPPPPPPMAAPTVLHFAASHVLPLESSTTLPSAGWAGHVRPVPLHLEQALPSGDGLTIPHRLPCSGAEAHGQASTRAQPPHADDSCSPIRASSEISNSGAGKDGSITSSIIAALAARSGEGAEILTPGLRVPLPGSPTMKTPPCSGAVRDRLRKRGMGVLEECSLR